MSVILVRLRDEVLVMLLLLLLLLVHLLHLVLVEAVAHVVSHEVAQVPMWWWGTAISHQLW